MGQKVHPLGFRLGITQTHNSNWYSKPKSYSLKLQEDFVIRKYLLEKLHDASLSKIIISRRTDRIIIEGQPKIVTGDKGARLKALTEGIQKTLKSISNFAPQKIKIPVFDHGEAKSCEAQLASTMSDVSEKSSANADDFSDLASPVNDLALTSSGSEVTAVRQSRTEPRIVETMPVSISFEVIQISQPATDARLLAKKVAEQLEKRVAFRRVMKQTVQIAREAGINGIKIQIAGRLNGAEIARSEWVREGRVPLHSLNAKIDYAQLGAQTIYGTLGIKIWLFAL
jgi:ribosomal protein S3